MDENRYIKLFNHGYFLSKHEPTVLKNLLATTANQPEMNTALRAGQSEFKKEKIREQFKQKLRDSETKDKDMDHGRDR